MSEIKIVFDKKFKSRGGRKVRINKLNKRKQIILTELDSINKQLNKEKVTFKIPYIIKTETKSEFIQDIKFEKNCENYNSLIGNLYVKLLNFAERQFK